MRAGRSPLALVLVLVLVLAGCAANKVTPAAVPEVKAKPAYGVLANAQKPAGELVAPTFKLLGAVAKGGPAYGAGEPSIAASTNGTLVVSFPGCDQDPLWLEDEFLGEMLPTPKCHQGLVYVSSDVGRTWQRLNKDGTGDLAADAPPADGDADVAVDANGSIYASNLGGGVITQRSDDGGKTWSYTGNVVPKNDSGIDRNWLAAAGPGHVIENWMGGNNDHPRAVSTVTSWNGGRNWTPVQYLGKDIGWEGSVQFAPDGLTAYIPFTQPTGDANPVFGQSKYELFVAKTIDGGMNWTVLDTNTSIQDATVTFHFSGMMLAPALGVTGDGHVVYAYAEEEPAPGGATNAGGVVKLIVSADNGTTWGKPIAISSTPSAIFPWVAAGAGDRIAITYFADNLPGDPDRTGMWDLHAAMLDVGAADAKAVDSIVDANVHVGGICSGGGSCLLTGGDRALLDYFENTVMPDGKIAIVYPADPADQGKYIEIRVAVQDQGSLMLIR